MMFTRNLFEKIRFIHFIVSKLVKIIDLSQTLKHKDKYGQHPAHPVPYIFPYITHEESSKELNDVSYTTEWLNINSHSGTHVDTPKHFDPNPDAITAADVSLDLFYGSAVCIDLSRKDPRSWITPQDLEDACSKSDIKIKKGDIVLLYTGHWNRTNGTPEYSSGNPGLTREACLWLFEKGVKSFGIDSVTPDNPIDQSEKKIFPCHEILRDRKFVHYENLANLDKVVGKRFIFAGFPLKLESCGGAPVRAVAILE